MQPEPLDAALNGCSRRAIATRDRLAGGWLAMPAMLHPRAPLAVCLHGSGCTGHYFDLKVNSWAETACERGLPCLMVDRPGHGSSAASVDQPLIAGWSAVQALLRRVAEVEPVLAGRPIALVGHSFGAAVALEIVARLGANGPAALCLSGIGDIINQLFGTETGAFSGRPGPYWLFGPGHSYDWRGVAALRPSAAHWRIEEIAELRERWPGRWPHLAGAVTAPVHLRLAEHERIWDATPEGVARLARSFTACPHVDAAILPDGGHLYEMHLRGPELTASQVSFICSAAQI